jgi:hypothetical protein
MFLFYKVPFVWQPEPSGDVSPPRWMRALADDDEINRVCSEFFRVSFAVVCGKSNPAGLVDPSSCGVCLSHDEKKSLLSGDPFKSALAQLNNMREGHDVTAACSHLRSVVRLSGVYAKIMMTLDGSGAVVEPLEGDRLPGVQQWIDSLHPYFFEDRPKFMDAEQFRNVLDVALTALKVRDHSTVLV